MSPVVRQSWPIPCAHSHGFVLAPLADGEHDRPAARPQRLAHPRVGVARVLSVRVAPVVLQVVDAPLRVASRVLLLVVLRARPLGARQRAGVRVEPEPEALGVHVVGERLHARGEALGVGHDRARRLAAHLPAVVDHDVLVAGVLHAARHDGVGGLPDERLAHVAAELVPAVPAHRRRERQAVAGGGERDTEQPGRGHEADKGERSATCVADSSSLPSPQRAAWIRVAGSPNRW